MARPISVYERFKAPEREARPRVHVLNESESLWVLAHRYYKDRGLWKLIARANGVTDARRVEAGARLVIPEAPAEKGSYGSR